MSLYPRFITKGFQPFDPVEVVKRTEEMVCKLGSKGQERKYSDFYVAGVYRGIITAAAVGCCMRCFFCWSPWTRDFPEYYGVFYPSQKVLEECGRLSGGSRIKKLRISCSEPTIGKEHLLTLLELIESSSFQSFILETNGILFGVDKDYVRKISKFEKVYVRVSLKAGTPEAFTWKTGAKPEAFSIPFKAIENLLDYGARLHVAVMTDPRIMSIDEKKSLVKSLREINPWLADNLEEEIIDPYDTSLARLKLADIKLDWSKYPL